MLPLARARIGQTPREIALLEHPSVDREVHLLHVDRHRIELHVRRSRNERERDPAENERRRRWHAQSARQQLEYDDCCHQNQNELET